MNKNLPVVKVAKEEWNLVEEKDLIDEREDI